MKKANEKGFLVLQSVLCVLLAALSAAAAVCIWLDGSARVAADPLAAVYTPQNVAEKARLILPLLIASAGLAVIGGILGVKDRNTGKPARENSGSMPGPRKASEPRRVKAFRAAVLTAAVAFILAGILNGSALDVLIKAITICSECIGLG